MLEHETREQYVPNSFMLQNTLINIFQQKAIFSLLFIYKVVKTENKVHIKINK